MSDLIITQGGQAVTSSLQVAKDFDKQHKHVLDSISDLEGVAENTADLFQASTYIHEQNKQEYRMYYMNRDGFTLLAMGFTGKEAIKFKMKYINAFNEMEKQLNKPMSQLELMQMQISQLVEQDKRLSGVESRTDAIEKKQENLKEVLSLNPTEWRTKVTNIIKRIGTELGGGAFYQQMWKESYETLEQRGKCDLSIRRTNKRRRMAENGDSESKRNRVSKLDVIADDARLTEIYLGIVKEMAIKYDVEVEAS